METKHTSGQWECPGSDGGEWVICRGEAGRRVTLAHVYDEQHAHRIIACVNYCAGLTDADLAALRATDGSETGRAIDSALKLRAQRDELAAALQYAVDDDEGWLDTALAALAKVRI